MTDKEIMFHRFSGKHIRKSTGRLAEMLGIDRKDYEAACRRAMDAEAAKPNATQEKREEMGENEVL